MKKLLFILGLLMVQAGHAGEMRPQFRVWKSSDLGLGEFSNTQISSGSIIFHMVVGSPTVNVGGDSYFIVHQSTLSRFASDSSTKVFCPMDKDTNQIGVEWNVEVSSHAFFSKRGGSRAGYLWDWKTSIPDYLQTGNAHGLRILRD